MASMHDSVRFKATVYAAIELSKKSWVVGIAHPHRDRGHRPLRDGDIRNMS